MSTRLYFTLEIRVLQSPLHAVWRSDGRNLWNTCATQHDTVTVWTCWGRPQFPFRTSSKPQMKFLKDHGMRAAKKPQGLSLEWLRMHSILQGLAHMWVWFGCRVIFVDWIPLGLITSGPSGEIYFPCAQNYHKLPGRSKQWIMLSSWFPTGPVRDPKIWCCDGMVTVWENIPNLWLCIFNSIHAQDYTGYSKCHSHPSPISITDQHRSNSCLHHFVVVPPLCIINLLRVIRW
jgi:hypothetical protein